MNYQQWFEANKKYIWGADVDAWCETAFEAGAAHGAEQAKAAMQDVKLEAVGYVWRQSGAEGHPLLTGENAHTATQLAAARLQGAEDERKKWADADDQTIRDRDAYHEMADDLAAQIAAITGEDIGEHSSINSPWKNAMLAADDFIAGQLRDLLKPQGASVNQQLLDALEFILRWGHCQEADDIAQSAIAAASQGEQASKRVPLTDDEIWKNDGIMAANSGYGANFETLREIVRAIETAHGITGEQT